MSKSVLKQAIMATLAASSEISSVEAAQETIASFQQEQREFEEAVELHNKLVTITENCRPADTRMAIIAANEALGAIPELQLPMVSMESSAEDHYEIAMEGIGDIIESISKFVKEKFKSLMEKVGKFKDAFTYVFKDEAERAAALLSLMDKSPAYVEGDIALPEPQVHLFQAGGKIMDTSKAIGDVVKHNEATFSPKAVEKGIAAIKANGWKGYVDGMDAISKVMMGLVKDFGMKPTNEIGDKPVSKTHVAYRTMTKLPANYYNYVLMIARVVPGDKREFYTWDRVGSINENAKFATNKGVSVMPALKEAELKKVLTAIKDGSSSNVERVQAISNWARNLDGFFDAFFKQMEDLTLTKEEVNRLYTDVYSLATFSFYAMSDNLDYHDRVFGAYLSVAKRHFK